MFRAAISAGFLALMLGGCAGADDVLFHGAFGEAADRGRNQKLYAADFKACGTGAGAEWCRLAADDGNLSRFYPGQTDPKPQAKGVYAFDVSQCDGDFTHGLCQGTVRVRISQTPQCHGEVIDGVCSQPEF